jgi:aminoglycoside phosphotransferase (APT) family kinase protein
LALHPYLSPDMREISKAIAAVSIAPCQKKAPHLLTPEYVALLKRVMARWDLLLDRWYQEPLTLVHGDSHLGNFFVSGEEMGMLDWQAVQWGKGIRDVQYLLIDSLPAEILAEHEEGLVLYYLAELAEQGVSLAFDEAWEQYRAYSFQTFITIVVSLGSGSMLGMDEVMQEILARCIAAMERLDFAGWADANLG